MSFSIQFPLSCLRSTANETPSIGERRRRLSFTLQLDINFTLTYSASQSLSATPSLSPASLLSPVISEISALPSGLVTPTDMIDQWPAEAAPTKSPTLGHATWRALDTPTVFETSRFSTNSKSGYDLHSASRDSPENVDQPTELLFKNSGPTPMLSSPRPDIPNEIDKSSPVSPGSLEEFDLGMPLSAGEQSFQDFAPRTLRPRSRRPRDQYASSPLQRPAQRWSRSIAPEASPAGYKQLSAREIKEMKLDPHRRYFVCLMEGCDRLFGRKSNADNHIRAHLDDKPFVCSLDTW